MGPKKKEEEQLELIPEKNPTELLDAVYICNQIVGQVLKKVDDEISFLALMDKIPDYNAVQTLEYAFQVNDVAIKNYDIKKDEHFIIDWDIRDDDNTEPSVPKVDPHLIDKIVKRTKVVQPILIVNTERSAPRRTNSRSQLNKSPTRRMSSVQS